MRTGILKVPAIDMARYYHALLGFTSRCLTRVLCTSFHLGKPPNVVLAAFTLCRPQSTPATSLAAYSPEPFEDAFLPTPTAFKTATAATHQVFRNPDPLKGF